MSAGTIVQALPAWLLLLGLVVTALWVLCTAAAHIPGLPPKVTSFFARAGTFLGDVRKMLPPPSDTGSTPKPPTFPMGPTAVLAFAVVALVGCSWFSSHETRIVHGAADVLRCVLSHVGEPPEQIAAECAIEDVHDVVDILTAYRAAERRDALPIAAYPLPPGSASACPMPTPSSTYR